MHTVLCQLNQQLIPGMLPTPSEEPQQTSMQKLSRDISKQGELLLPIAMYVYVYVHVHARKCPAHAAHHDCIHAVRMCVMQLA